MRFQFRQYSLWILFGVSLFANYSVEAQTASSVAKNVLPSVVMIQTFDDSGRGKSIGSGFFVKANVVATNYHVIKGSFSAIIKPIGSNTKFTINGVVQIDKTNDLVLLSVNTMSGTPLSLIADLSKVEVGQDIYALGNPQGLEGTITPGIISSKALRKFGNENLIQISAPISPGSSGGPVVNKQGQVIGVASASLESGQNLNFAVPATLILPLLNRPVNFISFADFAESELPSLIEATDWLTKNLSGLSGPTYGDGTILDTQMRFSRCNFTYSEDDSEGFKRISTGSIANLDYIGSPPGTFHLGSRKQIDGAFMDITFREQSIERKIRSSRRPEFDQQYFESSITIYLNDKRMSRQVADHFLRLKRLCTKP